jgi:hypothetical protein
MKANEIAQFDSETISYWPERPVSIPITKSNNKLLRPIVLGAVWRAYDLSIFTPD